MSALLETALATATIRYGALALLVFAGMGIYAAAGQMIGAFSLSEIRTSLSRRRAS
jgi:putative peptidoglycan lipid II flippase